MFKYIGNESFLRGVPARDLTEEEAQKYGVARLLDSGLYVYAEIEKPKRKSKSSIEISPAHEREED